MEVSIIGFKNNRDVASLMHFHFKALFFLPKIQLQPFNVTLETHEYNLIHLSQKYTAFYMNYADGVYDCRRDAIINTVSIESIAFK